MRLYIQYNAGFSDLVFDALKDDLQQVEVVYRDDSSMIMESSTTLTKISTLPYLKNSFLLIADVARHEHSASLERLTKLLDSQDF